jgi:hypothetical protein
LLTAGETVADTFLMMYMLQRACEVQLRAQSAGVELTHISPEIEERTVAMTVAMNKDMRGNSKHLDGSVPWPALLRRLDRVSPGFRN